MISERASNDTTIRLDFRGGQYSECSELSEIVVTRKDQSTHNSPFFVDAEFRVRVDGNDTHWLKGVIVSSQGHPAIMAGASPTAEQKTLLNAIIQGDELSVRVFVDVTPNGREMRFKLLGSEKAIERAMVLCMNYG